jgi:hypothetical protein
VAWVAKYRWNGNPDWFYAVHYRVFDPGRGIWQGDFWGWFSWGASRDVTSLIVRDGVVAWKSKYQLSTDPTDLIERTVHYVTYNPRLGSWPRGESPFRVVYSSPVAPENLRVKNGIVAWPMDPANNESKVDIYGVIYDPQQDSWVGSGKYNIYVVSVLRNLAFDWIDIVDNTAQVQIRFSDLLGSSDWWMSYDAVNHHWDFSKSDQPRPNPVRRASFIAHPPSGFVPFWVGFWDTSIALDGGSWSWQFGDGGTGTERSPIHQYTSAGVPAVYQTAFFAGTNYLANDFVEAKTAPPPPTGGIQINAGAAYTNSLNVTLQLNYSVDATQMCFLNLPGLLVWTPWEAVAPGKSWQLSTFGFIGQPLDGLKTVSVKFRDAGLVESPIYQTAITLDVTPPAPILLLNHGQDTTTNRNIRADWSGTDANGMSKMRYTTLDVGQSWMLWSLWYDYQPTTMWIPFNALAGTKTVLLELMDVAGNVIQTQDSVKLLESLFLPLIHKD